MAKARILVSTSILGVAVSAGTAVDVPAETLANLVALGEADDHPASIEYAESIAPAILIEEAKAEEPKPDGAGDKGDDEPLDLDALAAALNKLTKADLVEHADKVYALDLDSAMSKADMIAAILDSAKIATK